MSYLKTALTGAAVAIAATLAASAAGAVTIVNGSFEIGNDPGSFTTLANGDSTSIFGWTVGGLGVDYIGSYWQAADGQRSIDLSGNNKGSISQLLTGLNIGTTYRVDFSLAGNPDGGAATKVAVASDGGSQTGVFAFSQPGNTKSDMGWTRNTFQFVATDTTANLTFSSTLFDAYGPALDDVSISGGAVPEPATWAMMLVGFGGMGAMLRRRRAVLSLA